MSTVLGGVGTVSSAITYSPAWRALASSVFTALPFSVIRMPLSPREMALSMALIWVCVSPSSLPAATVRLTLSFAASVFASFSIDTKYGLDSVFKISETPAFPEVEPLDEPDDDEPQAARASDPVARQTAATVHRRVARDRLTVPPAVSMPRSSPIGYGTCQTTLSSSY